MITEHYLGGVLCHHGIKGMKWGVRRTPEQLGHTSTTNKAVEKIEEPVTIVDGAYHSKKGFVVPTPKLESYCLKPGTDHSEEFFSVGYTVKDSTRLFRDIEAGFELNKRIDVVQVGKNKEKFSIPIMLGITTQKLFRTVWAKDGPDKEPRFVTGYIDRRLKED